jgi:hypothetical protein
MGNDSLGWNEVGPFFRKFNTLAPPEYKVREHVEITQIDEKVT